jgi:hypothetical protein
MRIPHPLHNCPQTEILNIHESLGGACLLPSLLVSVSHQNPVAGDTIVLWDIAIHDPMNLPMYVGQATYNI